MGKRGVVLGGLLACTLATGAQAQQPAVEAGKALAFGRDKGNCVACHSLPLLADADLTGNVGPPLIAMQARFPDRKQLRDKIWDATASNTGTIMPPFGKHGVLSGEEIDELVEFLYAL